MGYLSVQVPKPTRRIYRMYDVNYVTSCGETVQTQFTLPAKSVFEQTCAAMARRTLIDTPQGPVAVEDLTPGCVVNSWSGTDKVAWIGSTMMTSNMPMSCASVLTNLVRIQASAIGQNGDSDIVLGPLARVGRRRILSKRLDDYAVGLAAELFGEAAFSIIPSSPMQMYQIMLENSVGVISQGLRIETVTMKEVAEHAEDEDWPLIDQLFPHLTVQKPTPKYHQPVMA
ncbi:MAG: Hint domain-containing protein [Planktomarina sp.]